VLTDKESENTLVSGRYFMRYTSKTGDDLAREVRKDFLHSLLPVSVAVPLLRQNVGKARRKGNLRNELMSCFCTDAE
jgi:hypothetical protein